MSAFYDENNATSARPDSVLRAEDKHMVLEGMGEPRRTVLPFPLLAALYSAEVEELTAEATIVWYCYELNTTSQRTNLDDARSGGLVNVNQIHRE